MNTRIVELRKALGMNQTAFAESVLLTQNFLSLVENGNRNLSDRSIELICKNHHVNEIWLRTGEGDMFSPISKSEELALITKKLMKDEDPAYREELIKIIADMDLETLKIWYDYAEQWVTNVENKK